MYMKKSVLFVLLALMLAFAGCQNSTPADTPGTTEAPEIAEKESDAEDEGFVETPDTEKDKELSVTPESKPVEPKLYERLAAWDDFYEEYDCYYTSVQIEDMFFYPGMMGSEVAEVVASSKDTLITPIAVSNLMEPDKNEYTDTNEYMDTTQKVTYYRNEQPWFDVYVRNYTDDLLPLADCIVSLVVPSGNAMEYCRFFDGTYTTTSVKEINYKDYEDFSAKMEDVGYTVKKDGGTWEIRSTEEFCPASLSEQVSYWTMQDIGMYLTIDSETGYVEGMKLEDTYYLSDSTCELYTKVIPEEYDWSQEKCAAGLENLFKRDSYFKLDQAEEVEVVSVFRGENEAHFICVFKILDGSEGAVSGYRVCETKNIGIDYIGNIAKLSEPVDIFYTQSYEDASSYIESLDDVYDMEHDAELIYEYNKNLVKEYKVVESFSDITAEQLYEYAALAIKEVKRTWSSWELRGLEKEEVSYITFGNADVEGGELNENAFWMIVDLEFADRTYFTAVDIYNPRINVETNRIVNDNLTKVKTSSAYNNYIDLLDKLQLGGTPEENPWITEVMPYEIAKELMDKYEYIFWIDSVDWPQD